MLRLVGNCREAIKQLLVTNFVEAFRYDLEKYVD